MSYTIEYDRQFIRSAMGYTPVWLAGDSNVTTGYGRYERRERHWGVFLNLLGQSKEDLLAAVGLLKGSSEHWKRHGKWIDDAGLDKWVEGGCKTAATIEDILSSNHFVSVHCYVQDYSLGWDNAKTIMDQQIRSTIDFDDWLYHAKEVIAKVSPKNMYPVVEFYPNEPIRHPTKKKDDKEKVLIKNKSTYLVNMEVDQSGGGVSHWTYKKEEATIFSAYEAAQLIRDNQGHFRNAKLVSATVLDNPNNLVVRLSKGGVAVGYVQKLTRARIFYVSSMRSARHYSTMAAAKSAAKRVNKGCSFTAEIIEDGEEKENGN